jgi:glycine cleavage system transcriptional repressor
MQRMPTSRIPYSVEAVSIDQPGIVHQVANFFSGRNINIQEMQSMRYAAAHTGTPMFTMQILISIPADVHIASLREDFLDFCETLNIDATMEPLKH